MSNIVFPYPANAGDTFTADNGVVYVYDGTKWVASGTGGAAVLNYIAAGNSNVIVNQGNSNVQVHANAQSWLFDTSGNITLPGNSSSINYANGQPYGGSGGGTPTNIQYGTTTVAIDAPSGNVYIQVDDNPIWTFNSDFTFTAPGAVIASELDAGDYTNGTAGDAYFHSNVSGTTIGVTAAGGITVANTGISIGGTGGANIFGVAGAEVILGGGTTGQVTVSSAINSSNNINTSGNVVANTFQTTSNLIITELGIANGTAVVQEESILLVYGAGANAVVSLGWSTNLFGPGNVAGIDFNADNNGNILMSTGNNSSPNTWVFSQDGSTVFPNNTITTGGQSLSIQTTPPVSITLSGADHTPCNGTYTQVVGYQQSGLPTWYKSGDHTSQQYIVYNSGANRWQAVTTDINTNPIYINTGSEYLPLAQWAAGYSGGPYPTGTYTYNNWTFDTAGNTTVPGNVFVSANNWYGFAGSDTNWRLGYGLNAFTTNIANSQTAVEIVIGTGTAGPDSFAIGQTGGASIFELVGYNQNAYFANNVIVAGTVSAVGTVATPLLNLGNTVAGPAAGGASDKITLYNFYNPSQFNYAIGAESSNLWFGVDQVESGVGFNFYGGNTLALHVDSTGNVSATGTVTTAGLTTTGNTGNITGANVISAVTYTAPGDVQLVANGVGNVNVTTDTGTWRFNTNGNLDALDNLTIDSGYNSGNAGLVAVSGVSLRNTMLYNSGNVATQILLNRPGTPSAGDHFAQIALYEDNANASLTWTFDHTGNLTLPGNTFAVNYANGTQVSLGSGSAYANTVGSFGSDMGVGPNYALNDPAILFGEDDVFIRTGGTASTGGQNYGELYLAGSEDAYFGQAGNLADSTYPTFNTSVFANSTAITINTPGSHSWTFDNSGNLTLPGNTYISNQTGNLFINPVRASTLNSYSKDTGNVLYYNTDTHEVTTAPINNITGDPFAAYASGTGNVTVWTASSADVVGAKLMVRVVYFDTGIMSWQNTEMLEIMAAKTYPNGTPLFTVSNRIKTNDAYSSVPIDVTLTSGNVMQVISSAPSGTGNNVYWTCSATSFNQTFD